MDLQRLWMRSNKLISFSLLDAISADENDIVYHAYIGL